EEDDVPPETLAELAAAISPEELQLYWQVGVLGRRDLPLAGDQRSGFALILVRMLAFRPGEGTTGEGAPAPPPGAAAVRASMARAAAGPAVASAPVPPGEAAGARGGAMAAGRATAAGEAPSPAGAALPLEPANWAAIVDRLGLAGSARQLAANCALAGRRGNIVRLLLDARAT